MAKRTNPIQSIHDLVVEASAADYNRKGGEAYTNPGTEKNYEVNGLYPDVVAVEGTGVRVIEEIETEDTVTEDECERQWQPYSRLNYLFRLIVPSLKITDAKRIVSNARLSVELQQYTLKGGNVTFYNEDGRRIS